MKKPKWKHREAARLMRRKKSSRSEERRTAVEAPVREPASGCAGRKRGGKNQFRQRQLEQEIKTLEEEKKQV